MDSYAAVLLYAEIGKFKDPIFREAPSTVPPTGTEVTMTLSSFFCTKHNSTGFCWVLSLRR